MVTRRQSYALVLVVALVLCGARGCRPEGPPEAALPAGTTAAAVTGADSSIAAADGKVVIDDHKVTRIEASGHERWTVDLGRHVSNNRPPDWVIHRNKVFIPPWPEIVALDDKTGNVLWRTPGPNGRLLASGDLLLALDCTINPPEGRWMKARSVEDGHEVWKVRLPDDCDPDAILDFGSLFLVRNGKLGGGSFSYLVDRSGTVRLKSDEYVFTISEVGSEILLVSNNRVARMTLEGQDTWGMPTAERWSSPWPFSTADLVSLDGNEMILYYFSPISDSGAELWRLNTSTGTVLWKAECPGLGVLHSEYEQNVSVQISGAKVIVTSNASGGNWREELSLQTGQRLSRD